MPKEKTSVVAANGNLDRINIAKSLFVVISEGITLEGTRKERLGAEERTPASGPNPD